jgi:hypothetical protein
MNRNGITVEAVIILISSLVALGQRIFDKI